VEANEALGLPVENRSYAFVPPLLAALGVASVQLMTNNPFKVASLEALGVAVTGRVAVSSGALPSPAASYLKTKEERMGHLLGPDGTSGGCDSSSGASSDGGRRSERVAGVKPLHAVVSKAPMPLPRVENLRSRL